MSLGLNSEKYIDLESGLNRVGGNMELYKRLLGLFVDGGHFETIDNALLDGDIDGAARAAHALKGVSANLSLHQVNALSAALESRLKKGEDYSSNLEELRSAFDTTMNEIRKI